MTSPECYGGFLSFCSQPIPASPFPRGTSVSEGFSSFHQLLEYVLLTGEVPSPPCVSLTPTLQPSELVELYERSYGDTSRLLDSSTALMLSQLDKREEDQFFESLSGKKLSSPTLKRRHLPSQPVVELQEHLAVSLRLNSPPALQAVLQERQLDLDKPLSLSPELVLEGGGRDTSVPAHPRLTALGLSALFSQGSPVCVKTLLAAGASVNSRDGERRTALHWTVLVRDKNTLRLLLKNGADVLCQDSRGDTPLHLSARVGDQKLLSLLLTHISPKASIDVQNRLEHSSLYEAASMGHFPCVRLLLRVSADPTTPGPLKRTCLHAACLSGSLDTVQQLLASQSSKSLVTAKDSVGATAVHYAAAIGRGDIIQALHNKGASLYAQDKEGRNMLHYLALSASVSAPITSLLLEDPKIKPRPDFSPLYHIPSSSGVTPLHIAALSGCLPLVEELLTQKCLLDSLDSHLRSPLSYAVILGRVEVVRRLSSLSPPLLNSSDLSQHSLLHYAAATGSSALTQFFLANPLSSQFLNHQNEQGRSPLHLAVIHTHLPCVQLLLTEVQIDVDIPDTASWTPLHYAVSQGGVESAQLLLQRGARFDSKHFTAIHAVITALHNNHIEVLELVLNHGYSPNTLSPDGASLLHMAILLRSLPLAHILLSHGAAINHTHNGLSPLDISLHTQQPDITDLLAQLGASTNGGLHHRAASLIQLRIRFLRLMKLVSWLRPLQSRIRGCLTRNFFRQLCRLRGIRRRRAASTIQQHWRLFRDRQRKYEVSYEMLRARLQAEKAAYALVLKKIKDREREAKQAADKIKLLRPIRPISKQRRQKLGSTSLPTIPTLPPVPESKPLPRAKAPLSLPKPAPPPPQVACYLDQYKTLTDRYQALKSNLVGANTSPSGEDPLLLRQNLREALNQAIVLRSDTDRLTLPFLQNDPTRPTYHLSL